VESSHPDKAAASRSINIFNDKAMLHFRNILKRRRKTPLDNFFVRERPSGSQAESNGAKRQKEKKKKPQEDSYLMFLWKGTPLPNITIIIIK
jgi:hypothetical protein